MSAYRRFPEEILAMIGKRISVKNIDGEEYQYVIFSNIISIYYEYYASIKQKISKLRDLFKNGFLFYMFYTIFIKVFYLLNTLSMV